MKGVKAVHLTEGSYWAGSSRQTPAQWSELGGGAQGRGGKAGLFLWASPGNILLDAVEAALGAVTANVGEVEGEGPSL